MAVNGTYKIQYNSPGGQQTVQVTLETDGNSLSGTYVTSQASQALSDCKVAGDDVEFSYLQPTPVGKMKLVFKGKVTGDEICGQVKLGGPFGSRPFMGKRI